MAAAQDAAPEGASGAQHGPEHDAKSVVLDIADLPLEDIAALPDTALGALLRRVHGVSPEGDPFVAGHSESQ